MTKRAIIYARVSMDKQRDNYSVPTQIRDCLLLADKKGLAIVGEQFVDATSGRDTVSGENVVRAYVDDYTSRELNRPALDAVFQFIDIHGADVLIVHAIDRLARDPYIRRTLEMELGQRSVQVEYVLGNYDETPEGEVRKDLDATFGKWENAKRVERAQRGKRGKAQRGLFVGGGRVAYGYRLDSNAPGGLAIAPEEAEVVKRIFNWCVQDGLSIRAIAMRLSNDKIDNYSGNTEWKYSAIFKILHNETYAGTAYYFRWKNMGTTLVPHNPEEWVSITVTPIISRKLFEEAQRRMAENCAIRRRTPLRFYLLRGMIYCTQCKYAFTGTSDHGVRYYRHSQHRPHSFRKRWRADALEQNVWQTIVRAIMDVDNLKQGYAEALKRDVATQERQRAHLETLEQAAIKIEQKLSNLTKAYIDPDVGMSKAEYRQQKSSLEDELADIQGQIHEIQEKLGSAQVPAELETFETFTAQIRTILAQNIDPNPEDKRRILEMLHVRVFLDLDEENHQVKGWFRTAENGVLSTTPRCYGRRPRRSRNR